METYKTALILDKLDRGTIQTSLQTNKYYSTLKLLNSSVKNWESICQILESDIENEILVLGKFTENTLFRMCLPEYETVVIRLINLLKNKKHLIFIYKSNLQGNFNYLQTTDDGKLHYTDENTGNTYYFSDSNLKDWLSFNKVKQTEKEYTQTVTSFIKEINTNLNILPYEKLIDIEVCGQNFIENIAEGLLFRIYVPNERIWSNEFDKFITLFRDYASNIANEELKITQNRTDSGTICSLYSVNKNISEIEINNLYKEFSSFMDLCSSNPNEAEKLINKLDIAEPKKQIILKKYIRESQRLLLDIKQERELKIVTIKHRLQNELQEYELSKDIIEYVENCVPIPEFGRNLAFLGNQKIENQTIIINTQIIGKVKGIVANELNGNITFNPEEQELNKIIEKFSESLSEASELQTSLYELKDNATPNEKKRTASQKLFGFLGKVGDKVGDVGVALLTKYLEQKMGI
ncbi:hypothetical protein J3S90_08785 [Flavobacterium sp. P4023]|uniref:Uncharacterized protein n=1 Tax=Flavobacterium flabelliforme TaxID=2816119 RepID=A0ABS5CTF5_9FLAO|nr:hypothetical protein [Flavobacterium flabelliforme]MBP4141897.1 hypothetical protein [Flavobacterium flabelliforme]